MNFDNIDISGFDDFGRSSSRVVREATVAGSAIGSVIGLACAVLMIIAMWKIFVKAGKPGWHALIPFYNVYSLCETFWQKSKGILIIVFSASGILLSIIGAIIFAADLGSAWIESGSFTIFTRSNFSSLVGNMTGASVAGIIIMMFGGIACAVGGILLLVAFIKTAKRFGKSGGFLVGMFFVPVVFLCIIAFGQSIFLDEYGQPVPLPNQGPNPNPNNVPPQYNAQPQNNVPPQAAAPQAPVNQQAPQAAAPEAPQAEASEADQAPVFCSGCGTKLAPGAKFCATCGKQIG